jgi:hypothetical protein
MSVDTLDDLSNYSRMTNEDWQFIRHRAAAIGVSEAALYKWRQRGVPHRYRMALAEAARDAGRPVPTFDVEAAA